MKEYFAKYIPIPNGFQRTVKDNNGIPIDFHQEVKLFLCSRDIQIGDDVYEHGKVVNKKISGYIFEDGHSIKSSLLFKVIGEISPNAKWIKEGDEFDEESIDMINLPPIIKLARDIPDEVKIACILGPCGHFH